MNSNLILGIIAFFAWSSFSTWYYVCQINEYCYETSNTVEQKVEPATIIAEAPQSTKSETDTSAAIIEQAVVLPAINISEDEIKFLINTTTFLDQSYVNDFTNKLKPQIEGRDVEVNIIGYTCDLGKAQYNKELGLKRAKAMLQFLNNNDINPSKTEVSSQGEIPSINGTKEELQKNRKVSITIKSINQ